MKNFMDNFITGIIVILIILIIGLTTYFCLDVFGIIKVPSKYSLASFFYTQVEVLAVGNDMTDNNDVRKPVNKVFVNNTESNVSSDYAFQVLNEIDKSLANNGEKIPAKEEITEILDNYLKKLYN